MSQELRSRDLETNAQEAAFASFGLLESVAQALPSLLVLGSERAQGAPLFRPLPSMLIQTRLNKLPNNPEDNDPDGVVMEWPADITYVAEEHELPNCPILSLRLREYFDAERQHIKTGTIDGVKDGEPTDGAEDTFRADFEVDSEGMGAAVELVAKPLGFRSRVRLRIMQERERERHEQELLESAQFGFTPEDRKRSADIAAEIKRLDERLDVDPSSLEALQALYAQRDVYSAVNLDDVSDAGRNSSEATYDFLDGYDELKAVRDGLVNGAYDWIEATVKSQIPENSPLHHGKRQERLRRAVEDGVNTVLFGMVADTDKLKQKTDHERLPHLKPHSAKLRAFRAELRSLDPRSRPSDHELKGIIAKTVEELAPQQVEDEKDTPAKLYVLPRETAVATKLEFSNDEGMTLPQKLIKYVGELIEDAVRRQDPKVNLFSQEKLDEYATRATWIGSGKKTQSGASRNLAGRELELVSNDPKPKLEPPQPATLAPALVAVEKIAMTHGRQPLLLDTAHWAESHYQGHVLGSLAALYALKRCVSHISVSTTTIETQEALAA